MTVYLIILMMLLVLSAFFSSAETAFLSLDRVRLEHFVRESIPGARRVSILLERPQRLLSAILIGNNLVNTAVAAVGTVLVAKMMPSGQGENIIIATLVMTILLVILGEVVPKTLAITHSFAISRLYAPLLSLWSTFTRPLVAILNVLTIQLVRITGGEEITTNPALSMPELRTAIRLGAETGSLETEASERMLGAMTLQQRQVQEIMVSRMDMIAVEQNQPLLEVSNLLSTAGFQRLPVYASNPDEVMGYVHVSDMNAAHLEGLNDRTAGDIMRTVLFESELAPIANVLDLMRTHGSYLVMLVDEFGSTSGLVTLEDIMEEVVGHMRSESGAEISRVTEEKKTGRFFVDGNTLLVDISSELSVDLTDVDANTVAGLLLYHLRRFPKIEEKIDIHGYRFTVLEMDGRRIARVSISKKTHRS